MLCYAADENMFEPGEAVRRGNDQIAILRQREVADLHDRRSDHKLGVEPAAPELHGLNKSSHSFLSILQRGSRKSSEPLRCLDIHRLRVAEIQDVEQGNSRGELFREPNCVLQALQ